MCIYLFIRKIPLTNRLSKCFRLHRSHFQSFVSREFCLVNLCEWQCLSREQHMVSSQPLSLHHRGDFTYFPVAASAAEPAWYWLDSVSLNNKILPRINRENDQIMTDRTNRMFDCSRFPIRTAWWYEMFSSLLSLVGLSYEIKNRKIRNTTRPRKTRNDNLWQTTEKSPLIY